MIIVFRVPAHEICVSEKNVNLANILKMSTEWKTG